MTFRLAAVETARRLALASLGCGLALASLGPARAEDFFAHKTISLVYGAPAGGVLDLHAQLLARHMGAHIAGEPAIVASAAPGAASKVLARRMFAAARKDGTEIGELFPAALLDPLLGATPSGYDPLAFSFLGSMHEEAPVCLLRKDAPAKSFADMLTIPTTFAVSAPGSPTFDFPAVLDGVLGAKIKLIRGYPGGQEMALAMERGEVNGTCGSWSQLRVRYPNVLKGGMDFVVVVHGDTRPDSDLGRSGAPSALTLAKNEEDRRGDGVFPSPRTPSPRPSCCRPAFPPSGWRRCAKPSTRRCATPRCAPRPNG